MKMRIHSILNLVRWLPIWLDSSKVEIACSSRQQRWRVLHPLSQTMRACKLCLHASKHARNSSFGTVIASLSLLTHAWGSYDNEILKTLERTCTKVFWGVLTSQELNWVLSKKRRRIKLRRYKGEQCVFRLSIFVFIN
jgi:hypothetical protein